MIEKPEISFDFYENVETEDIKVKFNAKDVIFDTADMENSFPFNLLQDFEDTNRFPLTVVMSIDKF